MRLHLNKGGHAPGAIDVAVVIVLVILVVAGLQFMNSGGGLSMTSPFIEPSQTVRR